MARTRKSVGEETAAAVDEDAGGGEAALADVGVDEAEAPVDEGVGGGEAALPDEAGVEAEAPVDEGAGDGEAALADVGVEAEAAVEEAEGGGEAALDDAPEDDARESGLNVRVVEVFASAAVRVGDMSAAKGDLLAQVRLYPDCPDFEHLLNEVSLGRASRVKDRAAEAPVLVALNRDVAVGKDRVLAKGTPLGELELYGECTVNWLVSAWGDGLVTCV